MTFQTVEQLQATVAEQAQTIKNLIMGEERDYNRGYSHAKSDYEYKIAALTAENERITTKAVKLLEAAFSFIDDVKSMPIDWEIGLCGCGEDMRDHSLFSGHDPKDAGVSIIERGIERIYAALQPKEDK